MHFPNLKEAKIRSSKKVEVITAKNIKSETHKGEKYFLKTYGCQMNVHDSEEIKAILENLGFTETKVLEESNIVVLNTCAIRENAHDKVFGFLGRVKHLKREKPELIVCVGGCMPQQDSVAKLLKDKYPYVDIVFGTHNINELGTMILNHHDTQEIEVYSIEGNVYEGIKYARDSKISAWVNIMYGCDKFCTYCIVPFTRGRERSREMSDILNEVDKLVKDGYQEITLLGQNVNAYGQDLKLGYDFGTLLEKVALTGIPRIRFVTSHPWNFTDEMINIIAKYDNVMPYIHLPLQSGSDRILKLMGRRYTKDSYLNLYNKIKKMVPSAAITTDIIVGFPGETEEDFNETLDVVHKCKYDSAFTFIFSPRIGTPAAKMKDDISLKEKEDRLHRLNEIINEYAKEANDKYLNQEVFVLLEKISEKKENMLAGYTDTMKLVNVKAPFSKLGQIVKVKITSVKTWSMDGEIVE